MQLGCIFWGLQIVMSWGYYRGITLVSSTQTRQKASGFLELWMSIKQYIATHVIFSLSSSVTRKRYIVHCLHMVFHICFSLLMLNNSSFTNEEFTNLCALKIKYVRWSVYLPSSDGWVERAVKSTRHGLKKGSGDSKTVLLRVFARYRLIPQSAAGQLAATSLISHISPWSSWSEFVGQSYLHCIMKKCSMWIL